MFAARSPAPHDRDAKLQRVEQLTRHMWSQRREPWTVSDAPADYIDMMLQGIVGLTLTISEVVAKTKASQNRTPADQRGALAALRAATRSASGHRRRAYGVLRLGIHHQAACLFEA